LANLQGLALIYLHKKEIYYNEFWIPETLRKYPPARRTERVCTEDFEVPNTKLIIKKGILMCVPVWSIHHDPEYYPAPEKFVPERFSKENKAQRNPYTYMPFGVGPRNCIGKFLGILMLQ